MSEHFVTHFNSGFLLQGMSLYFSMQRQMDDFTLWIVCLDDALGEILAKLELPNVRILEKEYWETTELQALREERSFRLWVNSLGIDGVYIDDLYDGLSDGWNLCKVVDKVDPTVITWKRVAQNPRYY